MNIKKVEGDGLYEYFFKTKLEYNNTSQNMINQYGNIPIKDMQIVRTPVSSFLINALNIISLGQFKILMKRYGFDKMYHLGLLLYLANGKKIILEKNQVININDKFQLNDKTEYMNIDLKITPTLNQLLINSISSIGKERHFLYDAFNKNGAGNCQLFVLNILKSSNILDQQYEQFIYQDLDELYQKLPFYVGEVAKNITDIGADADRLIGNGLDDGFVIHHVLINKRVPLKKAKQIFHDIIKSKKKNFYKEDVNFWSFRNIPKTKFIKDSFRSKKINDDVVITFGQLNR